MSLMAGGEDIFVGYKWEPEEFNVESYVGDTLSFRVRLREKGPNGTAGDYVDFDENPCTFLAQVREGADRSANLLKTLDVTAGDQTGEVVVSLPTADVQAELFGFWDFQVTWTDVPVEIITYLAGTFAITPKDVSNQ